MKKTTFLLPLIAAILFSCYREPNVYKINGKINGFQNGTAYLEKMSQGQITAIDSTKVKNGKFVFKGSLSMPEMLSIKIDTLKQRLAVFVENANIEINIDAEDIKHASVTGSKTDSLYKLFKTDLEKFDQADREFSALYNEALKNKDEKYVRILEHSFDSLEHERKEFIYSFISNHNQSVVAHYILSSQLVYDLMLDDLKNALAMFDTTTVKSNYIRKLYKRVAVLEKVAPGNVAPDITMESVNGGKLSLSQYRGQVVLVDFWASWCGPCRRANPKIVELFRKYNKKGFMILGVSLDKDHDAWVKAIHQDKLAWDHVSDLNGWKNAAAKEWGVISIPHSFLIGKDGTIIADNPDHHKLDSILAKILK